MQTFLTLTFLFALGAVFGWCMELVYRRLAHGKWVNPGFCTARIFLCTASGWFCCT